MSAVVGVPSVIPKALQEALALTVTSVGAEIVGFSVSWTVTLKEHVLLFPESSVIVNVFVVVPKGKFEPEGNPEVCTIFGSELLTRIKEMSSIPKAPGPVYTSGTYAWKRNVNVLPWCGNKAASAFTFLESQSYDVNVPPTNVSVYNVVINVVFEAS